MSATGNSDPSLRVRDKVTSYGQVNVTEDIMSYIIRVRARSVCSNLDTSYVFSINVGRLTGISTSPGEGTRGRN